MQPEFSPILETLCNVTGGEEGDGPEGRRGGGAWDGRGGSGLIEKGKKKRIFSFYGFRNLEMENKKIGEELEKDSRAILAMDLCTPNSNKTQASTNSRIRAHTYNQVYMSATIY